MNVAQEEQHMGARPPSRAANSALIRRLDAEWRLLSDSRWMRDRLLTWSAGDPRLRFDNGDQLVAAGQRRDVASWAERDQVLSALLDRAAEDDVARRVALQVVLPGLKSLIGSIRGWDIEERAARVVATALEVISSCATEPAGTQPNFRIYTNTRRRVLRAALRARSEPVVFVEDYRDLDVGSEPTDASADEQRIEALVEWMQERAHVREDAARLVVMSRAAGFSIHELASSERVDPQTLRQRRLRAERRVRRSLSLAL